MVEGLTENDQFDRYQAVVIFGAPGCGKGTQGKILGSVPGFFHVSTGDIFRNLDYHTELGQTVFNILSEGNLVPDDLTIKVLMSFLKGQIASGSYNPRSDLLVLDGFPRNVEQAHMMTKFINPLKILNLFIDDQDELIRRIRHRAMKEHRMDDTKIEVFKHRYQVYMEVTEKVLDEFPEDKIALIHADRSPAEVALQMLGVLIPVQSAHFAKLKKNPILPSKTT